MRYLSNESHLPCDKPLIGGRINCDMPDFVVIKAEHSFKVFLRLNRIPSREEKD